MAARRSALADIRLTTPDCFGHPLGDPCRDCREIREIGPQLAQPSNRTQRVKGLLTDRDELIARAASADTLPMLGTPGRRAARVARRGRLNLIRAIRRVV